MSLNHNLRRIICYIPYSEPVWPKRRTTVMMFWYLNDYKNRKRFTQWALNTKAVQLRLLPVRLPPWAYKERSLLSRESQQRQPPPTMRFPPDSRALRHRSLPHPDLRCYEATLQIPETTYLPMRALLDPYILARNSPSRYDQVVQLLPMTMKMVPVASSTTCSGNLNGFNNAGYKATFHPFKVWVPITESTLYTPMKCMRRLQRDAILIHWDVWSHHVRGASMQYLALDHLLRFCNGN
jgi:hypothetical protein